VRSETAKQPAKPKEETAKPEEATAEAKEETDNKKEEIAKVTGFLAKEYNRYLSEGLGTKETLASICECDTTGDTDELGQIGRKETDQ
jgi:CRISPR/Cas system CSM-associated protein Csm4 (group 5 of RAMP superfamily)